MGDESTDDANVPQHPLIELAKELQGEWLMEQARKERDARNR